MIRYYVKVESGVVVLGPKVLSSNPTDSPNTEWSKGQMKLNGFYEVSVECNELKEYRDLNNPTITSDGVSYPIILKNNSTYISDFKNKRIREAKSTYEIMLNRKYSVIDLIYDPDAKDDVTKLVKIFNSIESEISNLTTGAEIEAYTITYPSI